MPLGADDIVGIVALSLTSLHGCVKGLAILSKANHYDRDISNVRLQIELEQHRLFSWAEAAGLTSEPPTLSIAIDHAAYVPETLKQLEGLLCDLGQLKRRYGLELKSTSDDVEALNDDNATLSKLGRMPRESVMRADETIFRKRKSPWRRLRWATLDDQKVAKLLKDVRGFTSNLEQFLDQGKSIRRDRYLDHVFRDAVVNVEDTQKLEILGRASEQASANIAIACAARLKQTRLKLGLTESPRTPTSPGPRGSTGSLPGNSPPTSRRPPSSRSSSGQFDNMKLLMRLLTISRKAHGQRILTYYDDKAVMLEWKSGIGADSGYIENRVNAIAGFLRGIEPSFHSLQCRGYVKDPQFNRYGYIFDLPEALQQAPRGGIRPSMPEFFTLKQIFEQRNMPSLNQRLAASLTLLDTLLNLHTAGCLHKELRSDNILFFQSSNNSALNAGSTDISARSMYVAGYVYARADEPGEMTEPLRSDAEADLYRHPASMGSPRLPYQKSFDIFSVGCTLLEIGLWCSLQSILENHRPGGNTAGGDSKHVKRPLQKASTFGSTASDDTLLEHLDEMNLGDGPSLVHLRNDLLLCQIHGPSKTNASTNNQASSQPRSRCAILQSLEAATGDRYTTLVEDFLSIEVATPQSRTKGSHSNEHEHALDVEMAAQHAVQDILRAI